MTVRQATGVALNGRALLIEGPPGAGKTSIALVLIDRGATLIGDDSVTLSVRGGRLWAAPPPNIRGLIEIRGVGLAELPTAEAPVALILTLDSGAARLPEGPASAIIAGCTVPVLAFNPEGPIPALRAQWALRLHGLPSPPAKAQVRRR
jgi:hypothetical protein